MKETQQQIKALYLNEAIQQSVDKLKENKRIKNTQTVCGVVFLDDTEQDEVEVSIILKRVACKTNKK